MGRTLSVLRQCLDLCRKEGVQQVVAVGTSALRDARNRDDFVQRCREIGLDVEILTGDDEAHLSALAVRSDPHWRAAPYIVVFDIGGGSTEIVFDDLSRMEQTRASLQLGAVRVTEQVLTHDPPTPEQINEARCIIARTLKAVHWPRVALTAIGVGGTMTNMGAVILARRGRNDREALHGMVLTLEYVQDQIGLYASLTNARRRRLPGLDPGRSDVILAGALIVEGALIAGGLREIAISCRGLRWGVLCQRFGVGCGALQDA